MAEALTDPHILPQMEEGEGKRYTLPNPTLPTENLVAKWNNPEKKRDVEEFFAWAEDYKKFIHSLAKMEGRHVIQEHLIDGLGAKHVLPVFKTQAEVVAPGQATRSSLKYIPTIGISAIPPARALSLTNHTFDGIP
jgi:hypothetical protein